MANEISNYVLAPALQQNFIDKDTNAPLAAGIVTFYRDKDHGTLKPVYEYTGTPGNPAFTALPNPIILDSTGSFPTAVYYYPYDEDGNLDQYYITVESSTNVPQFDREAYPDARAISAETEVDDNYIANGQFLAHLVEPADPMAIPPLVEGEIRQAITDVAYGGWTFERPDTSDAKDLVTFSRFGSYVENPEATPRYAIEIETEQVSTAGDTFKDLRVKFNDVNTFASNTQQYTFQFRAESLTGGSIPVEVFLVRNYGTTPATSDEQSLATYNVTPSYSTTEYTVSFIPGDNLGKSIGTDDTDFVQIAIRFPVNALFQIRITDVLLAKGEIAAPEYPVTTTRQTMAQALGGSFPIPPEDGSKLYLPIILGQEGLEYDESIIGNIVARLSIDNLAENELLCDGTKFFTDEYASNGIPYARLQSYLYDPTRGYPLFGTGKDYFSIYSSDVVSQNNYGVISNNAGAPVTDTSVTNSPFSATKINDGLVTNTRGGIGNNSKIYFENTQEGVVVETKDGAAATGFTFVRVNEGNNKVVERSEITVTGLPGQDTWFEFHTPAASFYVWFTIDGAPGTDPSIPGYTGIKVDYNSADDTVYLRKKIMGAILGFEQTEIIYTDGSTITGGDYVLANGVGEEYFYWYTVNGVGTAPSFPGKIGIQVDVLSTDTAEDVQVKTGSKLNTFSFAIPDLRGQFLRGWNGAAGVDAGMVSRYLDNAFLDPSAGQVGTFQWDQLLNHLHRSPTNKKFVIEGSAGQPRPDGPNDYDRTEVTANTGGEESRPKNMSVYWAIKY